MTNPTSRDDRPAEAPKSRPWWAARRWRLAAKLVLTASVLYLTWRFASRVDWRQVVDRLLGSDTRWVAVGVAFLLGRFAALHHRWSLALYRLGEVPGRVVRFFVLLTAIFVNHVTPTARILGGLFRARYLVRESGPTFGDLYGTVLVDVVSNQLVQILLTWLAIIVLAVDQGRNGLAWTGAALLAIVLSAGAFWLRRREPGTGGGALSNRLRRWAAQRDPKHEALVETSHEAVGTIVELLSDRRLQWRMAAWGAVAFLANVGAQWVLFLAIGARVDLMVVAVTVFLGAGIGVLAGVPGGVGATEAAMIAGFVALGVGETDATAATLLYRGLHYGVILVTGLPGLIWFELVTGFRTNGRRPQEPPP